MIWWSILGIVIGLIILLFLMNIKYSVEEKSYKKKKVSKVNEDREEELGTRPRYCPVCNSRLGPKDVIYAEIFQSEPRDKVVIKGCKYCYRLSPEEAVRIKPYQKRIRQNDIGIGKNI